MEDVRLELGNRVGKPLKRRVKLARTAGILGKGGEKAGPRSTQNDIVRRVSQKPPRIVPVSDDAQVRHVKEGRALLVCDQALEPPAAPYLRDTRGERQSLDAGNEPNLSFF